MILYWKNIVSSFFCFKKYVYLCDVTIIKIRNMNTTLIEMIKNEYKNRFNKELTDNDTLNTLAAEASYIQQETSDLIVDKDEFAKFSVMYAFDRVFNTNTCMDFLPFDNTILYDDLSF